jgi:hypothetical protein
MSARTHTVSEHSKITAGIVTYNSADYVRTCLESVATHLAEAFPVIFVLDNASSDNTVSVVSQVQKRYPFPITVLRQETNHGYAWGANRICELAKTEWICLINPDARLLNPILEHVKTISKRIPTCGVIGGIFTDGEGHPQECGGAFPTPLMAVWDWCGLRKILPRRSWSTNVKLNLAPDAPPRRIDYPTGAFWIFRREVYSRVGPFDERFFLYFEETDFCKRALEKGWPSYILPAIRIEHHRGASFGKGSEADPLSIYFESLIKYLYKHFPKTRVQPAIGAIDGFLHARRWLLKDEKSERILSAFLAGRERATG